MAFPWSFLIPDLRQVGLLRRAVATAVLVFQAANLLHRPETHLGALATVGEPWGWVGGGGVEYVGW